jgi:predicted SprT family Zn-dependent metalloprotease
MYAGSRDLGTGGGNLSITLQHLYGYCKEQAQKWWGLQFNIEIIIEKRKWRRQRACFMFRREYKDGRKICTPLRIKINQAVIDELTEEAVYCIMLHELTHWALCVQGKPFGDKDQEFIDEIKRVGSQLSGYRYEKKQQEQHQMSMF